MKFKILSIEETPVDLKVIVVTEDCPRKVFSLPIEMAKDEKWLERIKQILKGQKIKKVENKSKYLGKDFQC